MSQLSLFDDSVTEDIVNVASVPLRSPFRYPGGKTWLVPTIRRWLRGLPQRPARFVEPFAGGGIISLTVAFEQLAEQVVMIELDTDVAAVWTTILEGTGEWLAARLVDFDLTLESLEAELSNPHPTIHELGFRTLLRNRVNHGGILAPGASPLKYGENGRGIRSRWYPQTLRRRILDIIAIRDRIEFIQGDGIEHLQSLSCQSSTIFFIDPPYTAAGKKAGTRLYTQYDLDHEQLFSIAGSLKGDFLMTYDNAEGVRQLAREYGFDTLAVPMKNTHHAQMKELLIGRNLDWARPRAYF